MLPRTPLRIYTNRTQTVNRDFLPLEILSVLVHEVTTCLLAALLVLKGNKINVPLQHSVHEGLEM